MLGKWKNNQVESRTCSPYDMENEWQDNKKNNPNTSTLHEIMWYDAYAQWYRRESKQKVRQHMQIKHVKTTSREEY